MRRALIAVSAVSALALLAACSDDHDSMPMDSMPMDSMPMDSMPMGSMPGVPADADYTVADVEFAQGMIAHHEQAIAMAEIALDPTVGASPEVVDLARRIQAAQDPEIDQMTVPTYIDQGLVWLADQLKRKEDGIAGKSPVEPEGIDAEGSEAKEAA